MAAFMPEVAVTVRAVDEPLTEVRALLGRAIAERDETLSRGGGGVRSGVGGLLVEGVTARSATSAEENQAGDEFHPSNLTTSAHRASGPKRHENVGNTGEM